MGKRIRYKSFDQISIEDMVIYSKLPRHSFWSAVGEQVDFSFADPLCAFLYTGYGQYPYAPSLKLKIHLVQAYYKLSDRLTEEKIIGDLFVKRFLGLPAAFFGFDHSTIGLDRDRMGLGLFRACHLYILAQLYEKGLWGESGESWIIDSFPVQPGIVLVGARRLIQQASLRLIQHTKRASPVLYRNLREAVPLDSFTFRLSKQADTKEQLLSFSRLAAAAHALVDWFASPSVEKSFAQTQRPHVQQTSHKLQMTLRRILSENVRPFDPDDDPTEPSESSEASEGTEASVLEATALETDAKAEIEYVKIPRAERPRTRIVTAFDPEARVCMKTKHQRIVGFKVQNLCTVGGVVLNTEAVSANEHDREAVFDMVRTVQAFLRITPYALLGDTAYGHGTKRELLRSIGVETVAPVVTPPNQDGKYDISQFEYDPERNVYRCPAGKSSVSITTSRKLQGSQFHFKKQCQDCSLRSECTNGKSGRSIFHSDYYETYRQAHAVNNSLEGRMLHRQRWRIEPKNAELKNACGLGRPNTRGAEALGIKALLAAMVVNLRLTVRRKYAPQPGFVRHARRTA